MLGSQREAGMRGVARALLGVKPSIKWIMLGKIAAIRFMVKTCTMKF